MNYSRPPPPSGAPPSYAFVTRVYNRSLRPVVIAIGSLSALWTLLWAIGSFKDIGFFNGQGFGSLATFSIVLGALYMAACVIELFGVVAAVTQRLPLVKLYSILSLASAALVVAAGFISTILHFTRKNDLINACTKAATGDRVEFRWGLFGPSSSDTLTADEANNFCRNAWDHDSWSEIVSLIIEIILGVLFSAVAFSYYRQLLDPAFTRERAPSAQARAAMNMHPQHYQPPYGYDASQSYAPPYQGGQQYAPPAGPPPGADGGKPPAYLGGDKDEPFVGGDLKDSSRDDPFADFEGGPGHGGSRV